MKLAKVETLPGRVLPYIRYIGMYVPPQRVWFLSRFGLKTGIDLEHFGLKLGMIIGETFTKAYFPSQQPGRVTGEREREIDKIYHSFQLNFTYSSL